MDLLAYDGNLPGFGFRNKERTGNRFQSRLQPAYFVKRIMPAEDGTQNDFHFFRAPQPSSQIPQNFFNLEN